MKTKYTIHLFRGVITKMWHWHVKARNGRIIACSGEGYVKKAHCRKMLKSLFPKLPVEIGKAG